MPRTTLVPRTPNPVGVTASLVTADNVNGMQAVYTRDTMFHVKTSSTALTATIATAITMSDGLVLPNRQVFMPSGGETFIGPFPQQEYMQADGNLYIDFSTGTGVTVEALNPIDPAG